MELKWLEDLVSVAEKGHFARAAEARHVTQSALSRRIKSLEVWVGTELLDRSQHPIKLTHAGEEFIPIAHEIVERSYQARTHAIEHTRLTDRGVAISCLHTMALYYMPILVSELHKTVGKFETSIIADTRTYEEYLTSLINGSSDLLICYMHPSVVFEFDEQHFPRLDIGVDRMLPYQLNEGPVVDLSKSGLDPIPYLEYSGTSYLSRVVQNITQKAPFQNRLKPIFRASLAESLCTAALQGLGLTWLPESIMANNPRADSLRCLGDEWSTTLTVSVYRSASNTRPIVDSIWKELSKITIPPRVA